jgi:hypothetical protein
VRSASLQSASATSPNPSEEIFDLYGCGWEIERIEHNLRAKALKISSYARFFVFLRQYLEDTRVRGKKYSNKFDISCSLICIFAD